MNAETKEEKDLVANCESSVIFTGINTGHYTWTIRKQPLIDSILSAPNGKMFESKPFKMLKLLWMIQLYPNGGKFNSASSGSVMIRLRLLSKSTIDSIQLICSIQCNQTLSCSTFEALLTTECGWIPRVLLLEEWQSIHPQILSITVSIKILKIALQTQNNLALFQLQINNKYIAQKEYQRKVRFSYTLSKRVIDLWTNSYYGKRFESAIFDNRWRLVIYPQHWSQQKESQMYIGLHLCSAPIYSCGVTAKYSITCTQTEKKWSKTVDLTYKSPTSGSGKFVTLSDISCAECVEFVVNVEILKTISVVDKQMNNEDVVWHPDEIQYVLSTQVFQEEDDMKKEMEILNKLKQKDAMVERLKHELAKQQHIMQQLNGRIRRVEAWNMNYNGLSATFRRQRNGERENRNEDNDNQYNNTQHDAILILGEIIDQIPKFT